MSEDGKYSIDGLRAHASTPYEQAVAEVAIIAMGHFGRPLEEIIHVDGVVIGKPGDPLGLAISETAYSLQFGHLEEKNVLARLVSDHEKAIEAATRPAKPPMVKEVIIDSPVGEIYDAFQVEPIITSKEGGLFSKRKIGKKASRGPERYSKKKIK
jgi:hypothetical protein